MGRAINVVLLFLLLGGFWAAHVMIPDPLVRRCVMAAVLVGAGIVCILDYLRARQQAIVTQRRNEQRIEELARQLAATGEVLAIKGSSFLGPGIFCVFLGGMTLLLFPHDVLPVVMGGLVLLSGVFFLALGVQGFGRPILELSRSGFATPIYGYIPWTEVGGVSLETTTYRGAIVSQMLVLRVPQVPRFLHQFAAMPAFFISRRSYQTRQKLAVALRQTSEHPDVILGLSKELLRKATGRDHIGS